MRLYRLSVHASRCRKFVTDQVITGQQWFHQNAAAHTSADQLYSMCAAYLQQLALIGTLQGAQLALISC